MQWTFSIDHSMSIKCDLISSSGRYQYCIRTFEPVEQVKTSPVFPIPTSVSLSIDSPPFVPLDFIVCLYSSHTQIPLEAFRRPGPTRIPKPKGFSSQKGTNTAGLQSKSQPPQNHVAGGREQQSNTAAAHNNNNNNPNLVNRRLWYFSSDITLNI